MIKLNTTPINRRYWINSDVIYKIENKKLGDGGAITSETVNTDGTIDYEDNHEMLPKIKVFRNNKLEATYYLDTFIEVGDKWNTSDGTVSKINYDGTIYNYFKEKCVDEIQTLIKSNPSLTVGDFDGGNYGNIIPDFVLNTNTSVMKESDGTTEIPKIILDTMIDNSKIDIVKDELTKSFDSLKKKYKLTETTSLRDFVSTNFPENQTSSTN